MHSFLSEIWINRSLKDLYIKKFGKNYYHCIGINRFVGTRVDKHAREHKNGFFLKSPGFYPISYRVPDASSPKSMRARIFTQSHTLKESYYGKKPSKNNGLEAIMADEKVVFHTETCAHIL